jgi:hypothetical protein
MMRRGTPGAKPIGLADGFHVGHERKGNQGGPDIFRATRRMGHQLLRWQETEV